MERRYAIWDVFTAKPLAGNPLAVVLDAGGLTPEEMQAIAREFNLSETVFVLPARLPAHTAYIRIFTPFTELQFAGHPTVGAAIQLADDRISGARPIATRSSFWRRASAASALASWAGGGRHHMRNSICRNCRSYPARPRTTTALPPRSGLHRKRLALKITARRNTVRACHLRSCPCAIWM